MMFAALAVTGIALAYFARYGRPNRWESPGVFAPENQFTPERLRDLCMLRPYYWPRVYAPDSAFAPERLEALTKPEGFFDRSICAPASAFTPGRLEALMNPVYFSRKVFAPDGREFEAPHLPSRPQIFAPDGRDLWHDAEENFIATTPKWRWGGGSTP